MRVVTKTTTSSFTEAIRIFKRAGGMLRTGQALRQGIHAATLYALRDSGVIVPVSRGIYRLVDLPALGDPDLVVVAARIPKGVVCLVSALAFHGITTQIPHKVHLALPRGAEEPRLEYPPIATHRFGGFAYSEGVEKHDRDGVPVKVYSPEKTLADCFKFRNKMGLDVAIEAIRLYRERLKVKVNDLMRYASICRVAKVMRPYLEALL